MIDVYDVNGYEIRTSKLGRSKYYGVTVSPSWELDMDRPFIAMQQNPTNDPILEKWLTAKKRQSLHLGRYTDSREAAYVSAFYRKHPEDVLIELYHNKVLDIKFPKKLYTLPVFLTLEAAQEFMQAERQRKKEGKKSSKPKKIDLKVALGIARDLTKGRKIENTKDLRLAIEGRCKMGMYIDEDDVRNHIERIVEYSE